MLQDHDEPLACKLYNDAQKFKRRPCPRKSLAEVEKKTSYSLVSLPEAWVGKLARLR
jgi:hypothetical protein